MMMRASRVLCRGYNFGPGPAVLFPAVMKRAQEEFCNMDGTGYGAIENTNLDATGATHPGEPRVPVQAMMQSTEEKLRELLEVPKNYRVIFMAGGAVGQFASIPLNLSFDDYKEGVKPKADLVPVGYWSTRVKTEASKYCDVHEVIPMCDKTLPPSSTWDVRHDTTYVHITLNETVEGLEIHEEVEWDAANMPPLVADATSTLLARPVDVSKYGAIYASGGKNLPHGVTVMIIREDLLKRRAHPMCPALLHFGSHGAADFPIGSAFDSKPNTPPVFPVWMLGLQLDHIKSLGGLTAMQKQSKARADRVYAAIDNSDGFYLNDIDPKFRSGMNVPFRIAASAGAPADALFDRKKESEFVALAESMGYRYLFGHPVSGGIRICMYIGQQDEAIDAVIALMNDFRK